MPSTNPCVASFTLFPICDCSGLLGEFLCGHLAATQGVARLDALLTTCCPVQRHRSPYLP